MRKRGEKQPSKVDHKDAAVASAKAYGEVSPYVLHPNTQFRGVWDAVQIAILCYVALAVPYRMGSAPMRTAGGTCSRYVLGLSQILTLFTAPL